MAQNPILWQPKALRQLRKRTPEDNALIRRAVQVELTDLSQARHVTALV